MKRQNDNLSPGVVTEENKFFWLRGSYKFWDDPRICLFMRFHGLSAFLDHFYGICQLLVNECALNTCRRHRSRVARKTYCVLCCFIVQEKLAIMKVTHYVNVSVLINFSQKTSEFTLIIVSSP